MNLLVGFSGKVEEIQKLIGLPPHQSNIFYWLIDIYGIRRWASFLQPFGTNPLVAYLLQWLLIHFCALLTLIFGSNVWMPILWPFWEKGGMLGILNGAVLTALTLFLAFILTRMKIVMKI